MGKKRRHEVDGMKNLKSWKSSAAKRLRVDLERRRDIEVGNLELDAVRLEAKRLGLQAWTASMDKEDRRVFNLKFRCVANAGLFTHAH